MQQHTESYTNNNNNYHNKQATNTYIHIHTNTCAFTVFCYEIIRNDKYARFLRPSVRLSGSSLLSLWLSLSLSMCPCLFVWLGQLVSQALLQTHTHNKRDRERERERDIHMYEYTNILVESVTRRQSTAKIATTEKPHT